MIRRKAQKNNPKRLIAAVDTMRGVRSYILARQSYLRQTASLLIIATSCLWLYLLSVKTSPMFRPWLGTLLILALWGLSGLKNKNTEPQFSWLHVRFTQALGLTECFSATYLVFSCVMIALLASDYLHPLNDLSPTKQLIDIELVSQADFVDHHDILPSTPTKPSTRKLHGATENVVSQNMISKNLISQNSAQHSVQHVAQKQTEFFVLTDHHHATAPVTPVSFKAASNLLSATPAPIVAQRQSAPPQKSDEGLSIEEVQPAQLMEIVENDGDTSQNLWQSGGRSTGGKGAPSALANYLKDIHKKLKQAWSPPTESSRTAEIFFVLKRTGAVSSVKLLHSSGDNELDRSAIGAILSSSPFAPLPQEYPSQFLNIRYTFNFTKNELSEISAGQQE